MLKLSKILLELEKIEKLYKRYNDFLKNNLNLDLNDEKKIKFEKDIKRKESELLLEYVKEQNIYTYIRRLLQSTKIRHNIFFTHGKKIKFSPYNYNVDYKEYYDETRYQELLLYSSLAFTIEQKGSPKENAFKLTILFDNTEDALKYILRSIKNIKSFYQACAFEIPDVNKCNFPAWRLLSRKYLHDGNFKKILSISDKIEDLVSKNKRFFFEKKINYHQLREIKDAIDVNNRELKKIQRNSVNRGDKLNTKIKILVEQISTLRLKLFYLSAGITLEKLDLSILLACQEAHLKKTNTDIYNYFLSHGLTTKDFIDKFLKLKRVDDDKKIPNITINGSHIGSPNFYLMKEPVLNDMHAARASCLGRLTNCCQSLSGESGESCVIHGLTSPHGGFYVLCQGDVNNPSVSDRVLAQSWAWRSQKGAIVFDSIESAAAENELNIIKIFFNELAKKLVNERHTHKVACGNTVWGESLGIEPLQNEKEYFIDYKGNFDSEIQSVVKDIDNPFYWYDTDDQHKKETEKIISECLAKKDPITSIKPLNRMLSWALSINNNSLLLKIKKIAKQFNRLDELHHIIDNSRGYMESAVCNKQKFSNMMDNNHLLFYIRNKNGDTPLLYAIKNHFVEKALKLIEIDAGVHLLNDDKTALHIACMNEPFDREILLSLIEHGVNVCADDYTEKTALHFLLERNGVDSFLIDELIAHGADINAADCDGKTPLHVIAVQNNISSNLVNAIFKYDANPNIKDINYNTPLHLAIENNNNIVFKKLIEHGADIETQNFDGNTALFLSVMYNNYFFLEQLVDKDVNITGVNKSKKNILHIISEKQNIDLFLLNYFIAKGVDVNAKDICNRNPLHIACQQTEINAQKIKILIENGVDVNAKDIQIQTPLHSYLYSRNNDLDIQVIKMLADAGANMDIKDIYCRTALDLIKEKQGALVRVSPNKGGTIGEHSHPKDQRKTLLFSRTKAPKNDVRTSLDTASTNSNINTLKVKI